MRYHFLTTAKGEKRVPFMTCAMTCSDVNIWPHPTHKAAISSQSLTFSMESIQLRLDTPYPGVESHYRQSFELFLKDLRRIQRLDFDEEKDLSSSTSGGANSMQMGTARETPNEKYNPEMAQNKKRRFVDAGQQESHRVRGENIATGSLLAKAFGGVGGAGGSMGSSSGGAATEKPCDIKTFTVNVAIHKFADMHLNFDTDESYQLKAECKWKILNEIGHTLLT